MKYLGKRGDSEIVTSEWSYEDHRDAIRDALMREQRGFCAYTEKYLGRLDSVEVEHFDDELKGTPGDGYRNWYAVIRWLNARKPRIRKHRPVLDPSGPLAQRIHYEDGLFQANDPEDVEADNLIALASLEPQRPGRRARRPRRAGAQRARPGADVGRHPAPGSFSSILRDRARGRARPARRLNPAGRL